MSDYTIIYGVHAVMALVRNQPKRIKLLYLQEGRGDARVQELHEKAKSAGVKQQSISKTQLDKMTDHAVHQGVVAQIENLPSYHEADLSQLLDNLSKPAFLLILDNVQDPHNLGACLRTANAAGVDAVIIPKDKSASLTATVQKVASGAAEVTPLITVTNLARTLEELKERGIWLYGTSDAASQSLYETDLKGAMAWVLGAEGTGMRRLTRDSCDVLVSIPMFGTVSSLNVSVAAGVCLFEAVRQRNG